MLGAIAGRRRREGETVWQLFGSCLAAVTSGGQNSYNTSRLTWGWRWWGNIVVGDQVRGGEKGQLLGSCWEAAGQLLGSCLVAVG